MLEVICPLSVKGVSFTKKNPAYLNSLQLKREHAYYTQVQAQMAVTGLRRVYFVVFTGVSLTLEVIAFDKVFWAAVYVANEKQLAVMVCYFSTSSDKLVTTFLGLSEGSSAQQIAKAFSIS